MDVIENNTIKEKAYIEKLNNGLTIIIIPKKNILKKYAIIGTHFGSIDNRFIIPTTGEEVFIPDGVAHFLEHKMFEQENGRNSLDVMMSLGLDANAYTTNNHTAYLFECTDNFEDGFKELMDYIQKPYFTDENVEKEKGIIAQEINMYNDDPGWQMYMNAMDCLYKVNPVKLDIAGTVDSISKINKDILYKCYNTFYNLSNMVLVLCGDFNPDEMINNIKNKIIKNNPQGEIKRIYPKEDNNINKKYKEIEMDISNTNCIVGFKDIIIKDKKEAVKRALAIEILLNMLIGKTSELYDELYKEGLLYAGIEYEYDYTDQYSHLMIITQTKDPKKFQDKLIKKIEQIKENGINIEDFERAKKKKYGEFVLDFNDVSKIARIFLTDYIKGINSFDYIEEFKNIDKTYSEKILKEVFNKDKMVLSVLKGKK